MMKSIITQQFSHNPRHQPCMPHSDHRFSQEVHLATLISAGEKHPFTCMLLMTDNCRPISVRQLFGQKIRSVKNDIHLSQQFRPILQFITVANSGSHNLSHYDTHQLFACVCIWCQGLKWGEKVPVWTYSFPLRFPFFVPPVPSPFPFPFPFRPSLYPNRLGDLRERKRVCVCDILSQKAFGGNKTISFCGIRILRNMAIKANFFVVDKHAAISTYRYGSCQKEVAVWFQAGQRSASLPYWPIPSHFQH